MNASETQPEGADPLPPALQLAQVYSVHAGRCAATAKKAATTVVV